MTAPGISLNDLTTAMQSLWPTHNAADWDKVGLVLGAGDMQISRVLFVVDVTPATVAEAIEMNCQAIVAHHPLLLRGVHDLAESTAKGAHVAELIRAGIALYSAHTNADVAQDGVAAVFAEKIGLLECEPIEPSLGDSSLGIGRVGDLASPVTLGDMANRVASALPETVTGVRVAGESSQPVTRVAVCPGAGDSVLNNERVISADVYITADLRHHPVRDAIDEAAASGRTFAVIEVSHWAGESLWLESAAHTLATKLPGLNCLVSSINTDPWLFSAGSNPSLNQQPNSGAKQL